MKNRTLNRSKTALKIVLISCFFWSCKTVKVVSNKTPKADVSIEALAKEIKLKEPTINRFRSRVKAVYEDGKQKQQVVVQLRMEDKKFIWLSASMIVPIAKLYLEPNGVSFYEKFQKRYFKGDYEFINALFDTQFGFKDIENLLLGNALVDVSKGKWKQISNPQHYLLTQDVKAKAAIQPFLFFDPQTFLLKEQRYLIPGTVKTLSIKYPEHQRLQGKYFPKEIEISFFDGEDLKRLVLDYTRVDFPEVMTTPFKIPNDYKKIEF